jgi:hypothetical protein
MPTYTADGTPRHTSARFLENGGSIFPNGGSIFPNGGSIFPNGVRILHSLDSVCSNVKMKVTYMPYGSVNKYVT